MAAICARPVLPPKQSLPGPRGRCQAARPILEHGKFDSPLDYLKSFF